jgi:phospholipid/cholesterol/gamma-HCH transport system substrate-binding protein
MLREPALYQRLDTMTASLDTVLSRMAQGRGSLGRLSKDEELYLNLKESSQELKQLIGDIKKDPKRYLGISIF